MRVDLEKMKRLRKERKITQTEIAKKIGYKTGVGYHYIETGKRKIKAETLAKIAEILNIPVNELYEKEHKSETA